MCGWFYGHSSSSYLWPMISIYFGSIFPINTSTPMGNHKYTIHKSSDNALQEPRDFVRLVEVTTWGRGEK